MSSVNNLVNGADTAWLLISGALVLFMTPGLALFYGGMVRAKSTLNIMMMSFSAMGVTTIIWVLYGYSISFGKDVAGIKDFIIKFTTLQKDDFTSVNLTILNSPANEQ